MDISFVFRKFRKSISGFTILALLATFFSFGVAQASTFSDTEGHWGEAYIDALYDAGVVSGDEGSDTFRPDDTLNRAELAKMLVEAYTEGLVDGASNPYSDVSESDWFIDYAASAYSYGIMTGNGDTGNFDGAETVNRATLIQAVYNAAGLTATGKDLPFDDVMSSDWYYDAVDAGYWWSVIDGESENTYNPAGDATRAAAAKVIYNGWYPVERDGGDTDTTDDTGATDTTDTTDDTTDTTTSTSTLNLSIAADTPAGETLPSGATSVEVFAFDAVAEGDDVNIDSITFNQEGVASLPADHAVYVYAEVDGMNTRMSSGQSVNSSTHDITFNNLDIEVAEGETVRVSVRVDVGTVSSTGEFAFQIESADMVDADGADVAGDFPILGESFDLSTTAAGTLTIEKNGSIDNPQLGEDSAVISKFKMTAATEAADLQELGVYISGSVNTTDMANFKLYVSGEDEPIGMVDMVDSLDVARFTGLDYQISKGGTKSFYITADFNTGRTDDTVKVYIDESTDVLATGDLYGFGMAIDRTLYDGNADACASTSSNDCSYSTLEGGDITISSDGPNAMDIAINGDDIVLLNFDIAAVTDVTFKNFPIGLLVSEATNASGLLNDDGTTSTGANFTDIKIVNTETGEEIFSSVDSDVFTTGSIGGTTVAVGTDDAQAYYLYTDDVEMSAGDELSLALTVDVENNTNLDGDTIVASLQLGSSYPEVRDSNNKVLSNSSYLVPSSAITSKTHTLRSPSLSLALASTPVSDTFVKGSEDVPFTGIVFTCGDASDCRITDLTTQGYLDDDTDDGTDNWQASSSTATDNGTVLNSYVGSIWLEDGDGNVVDGPESVSGTTFATTFSDIDWTLAAGETAILYIMGDLSSDSYKNSDGEYIAFGIDSTSDVTVEDEDGNTFTPTGTVNDTASGSTDPSTYVTVSEGGSLTIAVSGNKPNEDIVVAGTDGVEVSKFKFTTTDEAFLVTDLALNARQSGVAPANIGDYDNNIQEITISYPNSNGDTEEATGFLTNGTAKFTGLNFYIPADDNAEMTVAVDVNTIEAGASASEFIELNIAFNNFEAIAQGSGETYNASKYDSTVASNSDLDFGNVTWTSTSVALGTTSSALTLGSTATITTADLNVTLPVGTLVLVDNDGSFDSTNSTIFVLTSQYDDGDTTLTGMVIDDADTTPANTDNVYYSLPGTGYFTATERMHVQETKPTLALNASSPSGVQSTNTNAQPFIVDVTADAAQDVTLRSAVYLDGTSDLDVEFNGVDAEVGPSSTQYLSGIDTSSIRVSLNGLSDNDCWYTDTGYDLSNYARISAWYYVTDDTTLSNDTFTSARYVLATDGNGDATANTEVALDTATNLTEGAWTFRDAALSATAGDQYLGFCLAGASEAGDAGDYLYLDEVKVYNEKITLDISGSGSLAASDGAQGLYVKLKNGGTTEAHGFIDQTSTSAATVVLIPTIAQGDIEITEGQTETYAFEMDTTTLMNVTSNDDFLTLSMDMGTSTDGTISAGDFWWYDDNETVKWLGDVSTTTLSSNTLTY